MYGTLFDLAAPVMRRVDPETAHELTLKALERGVHPRGQSSPNERLQTTLMGLELPTPVGVAAGFDKDGRVPDALLKIGFGFAEVGTVTPRAQQGNPKPRVFRLSADRAIINRNGFNNAGHDVVLARLSERDRVGVVGVNLGANKDSVDRVADYVSGVHAFYDRASYFMVNVSSPNTPGLRDLQAPSAVRELLTAVNAARARLEDRKGRRVPIGIKLAPDIADEDVLPIVSEILKCGIDAIAISNTTITRPEHLQAEDAVTREAGGLSGAPMFDLSTRMLARVFSEIGRAVPLIGIGGIDTGPAAVAKMKAGATAVQLYTGLVFKGPELLANINDALLRAVQADAVSDVSGLVGVDAHAWSTR